MDKIDYYELLECARDADGDTIKRSYRKLAMQHHPDRNQGNADAEHKFKEINEAYDVLKDPDKRAAYDRYGHAAFENGGGRGAGDFGGGFGGFADIFDEMFGEFTGRRGGGGANSATRGSDLRYNMQITLEEAFHGRNTTIKVPSSAPCEECDGSGAEKGSKPITCGTCHGRGKVRASQGFFTIERACPTCQGAGKVIEKPCRACQGAGRVRKEKTLSVNIPAGVEEGTRIRLTGEGEAGLRGGPSGDLYIFLSVAPHRLFQRDGANVYCRVPISMSSAALGGSFEVPCVDGTKARVAVPAGTQSGHQFRLKGKGMSVMRSAARGDMYIQAAVETPMNLTKKQKELLAEFDKAGKREDTNPETEGFFAKVRELWDDLRE